LCKFRFPMAKPNSLKKLIRNLFSGNFYVNHLSTFLFGRQAHFTTWKIILYFFSFSSQLIFVLLITISAFTPFKINGMDPAIIDVYPNFIWVYLQNHYIPQWIFALTVITFYAGNNNIWHYNKRQIEDFVNYVKESLNIL
jgi:hypothetical protein